MIRRTWFFTVFSLICSRLAISLLGPSATRVRTSSAFRTDRSRPPLDCDAASLQLGQHAFCHPGGHQGATLRHREPHQSRPVGGIAQPAAEAGRRRHLELRPARQQGHDSGRGWRPATPTGGAHAAHPYITFYDDGTSAASSASNSRRAVSVADTGNSVPAGRWRHHGRTAADCLRNEDPGGRCPTSSGTLPPVSIRRPVVVATAPKTLDDPTPSWKRKSRVRPVPSRSRPARHVIGTRVVGLLAHDALSNRVGIRSS